MIKNNNFILIIDDDLELCEPRIMQFLNVNFLRSF